MTGHGIAALRRKAHAYSPWPGNVICRCGLRAGHAIHTTKVD